MNGSRFDTLSRSLALSGFGRRALVAVIATAVAPLVRSGVPPAEAHNALRRCKKFTGHKKRNASNEPGSTTPRMRRPIRARVCKTTIPARGMAAV